MSNGTGTWLVAYWDELESVDKGPLVPGSPVHGVYQLPPPLLDFGFTKGLWRKLNAQLGTNFDFAESEDVPPDLLAAMAKSVRQHALEEYGGRAPGEVVRAAIGKRVSPPEEASSGRYLLMKPALDDRVRGLPCGSRESAENGHDLDLAAGAGNSWGP
jgi:hypothetical protein